MVDNRKCAIIGCGFVGSSSAFSLMQSGLFSEIVLIDTNTARAEGEAMDLSHGIPFSNPMEIHAGSYEDISNCGIVIITAGASQKPGETRLDLAGKNIGIFRQIIPEIVKHNSECTLMIVANPVDVLTYTALKLSGFPANRVIGTGTVLDTARLRYLLSRHLKVDSHSIHAFIIGEHGDSELIVGSSANISGVGIYDFCRQCDCHKCHDFMKKLGDDVRNSAYEIIKKKGSTYYGIAMSVRRIAECILRDEHSIIPVSSLIEGHYGLHNICISVPTVVGSGGAEKVVDIELNSDEQHKLESSAQSLREVLDNFHI